MTAWPLTLQVEQRAAVGGGVGRGLGDGQQEGAVPSQQDAHEAEEGLLDLQLQLLLAAVDLIVVRQQELQRGLLLAGGADCRGHGEPVFTICSWAQSSDPETHIHTFYCSNHLTHGEV